MLQETGPRQRELRDLFDVIARQTTQLTRLLDDLLDVGRITSGKIVLRKERIGLGQALASAIEASRPLIDSLGHHLTVTQPDQPIELDGDGARLSQVFANLLNNAAKYTDRGGRIAVEVAREGDQAVVHVRDNGIGIQAAQLPRLFEMFSQGDQPTGRGHGGLGVGLALARQLVELHGGSIEARSAGLGTGSEFTVRLPVARPRATPPASLPRPEPLRAERPLRILVADDNADSAVLLAAMLRHTGHEVETAFDGLEALAAVERLRPDVAILDLGMPRLSGLEVARRIRELPASMVLIAMTGWGQEEDKRAASEAGFDHHLTKPVEYAVLHRLLERVEPVDRPV
jgi:CheY-like chemotaxis protein